MPQTSCYWSGVFPCRNFRSPPEFFGKILDPSQQPSTLNSMTPTPTAWRTHVHRGTTTNDRTSVDWHFEYDPESGFVTVDIREDDGWGNIISHEYTPDQLATLAHMLKVMDEEINREEQR